MMWGTLLAIPWRVLARTSPANTNGEQEQTKSQLSLDVQRVQFTRSTGWVWRTFCSELTAVVSFIPCFYFLFLTVVAAAIIGLFNISRSERVHQDPSPGVERNVTATKRAPRLFMVVPKTKHGPPAKKAASSLAAPTEKAAKKSTTNQGALTAVTRVGADQYGCKYGPAAKTQVGQETSS